MLRPRAVWPALAAASLPGRARTARASLQWPLQRLLTTTRPSAAYPKEGVFQPNSPPRNIPGFGPAPPSPHQPQPQSWQQPYAPQQNYPGSPGSGPPPRGFRRWMPTLRWYKVLGALGVFIYGFYSMQVRFYLLLPLEQGTEEDLEELEALFEELDDLPLVQQLRDETKQVDGEGWQPVWREWTAYHGLNDDGRRAERLTTGPLGGSAGVAAQRVFWNQELQQMFLFINFGPGTQGWPQAVHGGALSTIFDEALGRVAIRSTEVKTAVTATLNINFMDRVVPGQWHVLFASIDPEREAECTDRKKYVQGVLGCCGDNGPSKDGDTLSNLHPHAVAKGLFVVPKTTQLNALPDEF